MGWFSKILGTEKVIDNVFDKDQGLLTKFGGWIDGQQYTAQEQAEHNSAMVKSVQTFAIATMAENTDRSKARRTIAVGWFGMQVWLIKLNTLCILIDYLIRRVDDSEAGLTKSVAEIAFNPYLWGITGAVSVFFFGAHMMRGSKFAKEEK